jgi:hypothetical protein
MALLLLGALLVVIGVFIGRLLPNRPRRPKPPKPVEPLCGCRHHRSFHDDGTSRCHYTSSTPVGANNHGLTMYEKFDCTCRKYIGPVTVEETYTPELSA